MLVDADGDQADAARVLVERPDERDDLAHAVDHMRTEHDIGRFDLGIRPGRGRQPPRYRPRQRRSCAPRCPQHRGRRLDGDHAAGEACQRHGITPRPGPHIENRVLRAHLGAEAREELVIIGQPLAIAVAKRFATAPRIALGVAVAITRAALLVAPGDERPPARHSRSVRGVEGGHRLLRQVQGVSMSVRQKERTH
ncbi:MAG: hypothetical protein U0232_13430 [Thermomicrobiales bacterium]